MTIKFFIQSKKSLAKVYIRVRDSKNIDAKSPTKFLVNPKYFQKGSVKLERVSDKITEEKVKAVKELNQQLNELQINLDIIKNRITQEINQLPTPTIINSQWLKEKINPKNQELPLGLIEFFDIYLERKRNIIADSTNKKLKSIKARIQKYENSSNKVYIPQINTLFSANFQKWATDTGYHPNTILKTLKVIKTICLYASDLGLAIHPQLVNITKNLKYSQSYKIHLTELEINQIIDTEMDNERLKSAKDWLIISCFTAQRVSDFLLFKKENIISMEGHYFLDIKQNKTDSPVYIPLTTEVMDILNERNGKFPPQFSENIESNKAIYNKLIKIVCRKARINQPVKAFFKNAQSGFYESKIVPKYKAVSTHIGRRSFATNYYGKVPTALLISATGHASEKQFLTYVGKKENQNALALARAIVVQKSIN
ncbi:phage integrase SAM-like domain-containing protein [Winogradskyella flava]|uniref:phage integrase SAM-like domain-containing protein n=1 Tax=Winogradskyella flava TaxID=1884876 RepID=UPI002493121C|nr:phage integrase SAM-like domain-containing protein [Winogradskyella flava]